MYRQIQDVRGKQPVTKKSIKRVVRNVAYHSVWRTLLPRCSRGTLTAIWDEIQTHGGTNNWAMSQQDSSRFLHITSARCRTIFKILSLPDLGVDLQQSHRQRCHHTLNRSPHYLVKYNYGTVPTHPRTSFLRHREQSAWPKQGINITAASKHPS